MSTLETAAGIALLAAPSNGHAPATKAMRLSLGQIEADGQIRKLFDAEKLQQLAESLKTDGQLQPILVYHDEGRGRYIVLAGERRLRAARLADLEGLDCVVFPRRPTPSEIAIVQITENTLREGLDPIEEATGFQEVMNLDRLSANQLAERLHLSTSTVTRALALLELPADLQDQIREGGLKPGIARELARLPGETQRRETLERVRAEKLTAEQTAKLVSKLLTTKRKTKKPKTTKTSYRVPGFEAVVTPKRIVLTPTAAKQRTREETILALETLIQKLREEEAAKMPA